jgi:hypothetical protein
MKFINYLIISLILISNCKSTSKEDDSIDVPSEITESYILEETKKDKRESNEKLNYFEQISCNSNDCIEIDYDEYNELDSQIKKLIDENAGKILIRPKNYSLKLNSDELDDVLVYLREISKRDGQIAIEPLYIGERLESSGIPFVKDLGLVGYTIFQRIRTYYKYKNTNNYNAKILYHPKYETIVMIFLIHKNYGDICNTIFSNCRELDYVDDEMFDMALSKALKDSEIDKKPVKVKFTQTEAKLFDSKLELSNLKNLNTSARLYKWLVVTQKTEKKPIIKDRFLGIQAAISVIDYSITLYDTIKAIQMYAPALKTIAEVNYSGNERGGKIKTVTFRYAEPEQTKNE